MYQITPGSRENGVVKASLGFNTITHRPVKFKVYKLEDIGGIAMPTDGLVFYAPLSENSATAATGQTLTTSGTVSYDIINNVSCAYFNNSNINSAVSSLPTGGSARTISLWLKASNVRKSYMLSYGSEAGNQYCTLMIGDSGYLLGFVAWGNDHEINTNYDLTKWTHYLATYENGALKLYVNGNQEKQIQISLNTGSSNVYLGSRINNTEYFNGYIAAARIYDRVLTQDEITLLSREFNSIWSCPRFSSNTREDSTWKVTCGSEWNDNFMCGKVFNGDFTYTHNKGWAGADNHPDEWLLIQNKVKPVNVKKIYILPTEDGGGDGFNSFKLYGSNDNSSFDLLYESNTTLRASDGGRYYTFDNKKRYSYYKMTFQCSRYVFLGKIAMFSDTNATIDTTYDYF